MKQKQTSRLFLMLFQLASILLSISTYAQDWNVGHAISTATGSRHFSYTETPPTLIELYPPAFPNIGFTYQWESGTTPLSLSPINGATASSYSFSGPLTHTI